MRYFPGPTCILSLQNISQSSGKAKRHWKQNGRTFGTSRTLAPWPLLGESLYILCTRTVMVVRGGREAQHGRQDLHMAFRDVLVQRARSYSHRGFWPPAATQTPQHYVKSQHAEDRRGAPCRSALCIVSFLLFLFRPVFCHSLIPVLWPLIKVGCNATRVQLIPRSLI